MIKVLGLNKIVWTFIALAIQVLNFGFLVGAMNFDLWFHQNWTATGAATFQFKGQLLNPSTDLGTLCDNDDTYNECYNNCENNCDKYKSWYSGGSAYVCFDTIASIFSVVIAAILILDALNFKHCRKLINFYTTAFIMVAIFALHFLSFIIWAGTVKLRFDGCSHNIAYDGTETVCGEGGAAFALWNLFYLFFINFPYFYISRLIVIEEQKSGENNEPILSQPHPN